MRNMLIAGAMLIALICGTAPAVAAGASHKAQPAVATKKAPSSKHKKKHHKHAKTHKAKHASKK